MSDETPYTPPRIWTWDQQNGGQLANINRPVAGATHEEVKRQMDVLDRRMSESEYLAGTQYTIADMAVWPWYGALAKGLLYDAGEFLQVVEYKNVQRWADAIGVRSARDRW